MARVDIPCRQNREEAREATIMSAAGKARFRIHSLPSTMTTKPFCNIEANDMRQKMIMKMVVGVEGILLREELFRQAPVH